MPPSVTLRQLGPDDDEKVALLSEPTPDTGAVVLRTLFHRDPYATLMALHPNAIGVVAEA